MPTIAESTERITSIAGLVDYYRSQIETPEPLCYDLGCGKTKMRGFLGVDLYAETDVQHDLVNGNWSFTPDDSVDFFYASHFFEHIADQHAFMDKAHRKLKGGGFFLITTPYGLSPRAWQDPDHKRPIFRETYWYFNKAWRELNKQDHRPGASDFDVVNMWPVWNPRYATRAENNPDLAEKFMETFGAVNDLTVLLRARK